MKQRIIEVVDKWRSEIPQRPIAVFDREGYDKAFFFQLVKAEQRCVTWDKNVDSERLAGIDDKSFTLEFTFNGKRYSVFEGKYSVCPSRRQKKCRTHEEK